MDTTTDHERYEKIKNDLLGEIKYLKRLVDDGVLFIKATTDVLKDDRVAIKAIVKKHFLLMEERDAIKDELDTKKEK